MYDKSNISTNIFVGISRNTIFEEDKMSEFPAVS